MSSVFNIKKRLNPLVVISLSFLSVIFIGTFLLMLPCSSKENTQLIDALFTSTSAVCVTGLVTCNTLTHWTTVGHIIILCLIQIGGLGFMTMATAAVMLVGRKISLESRLIVKEQFNQNKYSGMVKLLKRIIILTFIIEFIGSVLLSIAFIPIYGIKGIWLGIFHSISAFCNAGFDITGNSITDFKSDILINITISLLVIMGGLGFNTLIDIKNHYRTMKFNIQTKLILIISSFLIILGTILIFLTEYNNISTIGNDSLGTKILESFFQSVILRTAGFNSFDISKISEGTAFIMIIFMFIGASPGSTGGGIKTTTVGVLFLSCLSEFHQKRDITVFKKRISYSTVRKSLVIVMSATTWICITTLILYFIEKKSFICVMYETVSAFATVGVSMGITSDLSFYSKLLLCLTMYIGRVGFLTLATALLGNHSYENNYKYCEVDLTVG